MSQLAEIKPEDYRRPQPMSVIKRMGSAMSQSVEMALPGFMKGQGEAILRAMYTECSMNPKLLACTPESLFAACIRAAQLGLQIGGALGQCYLIPFGGKVQFIPGYKGYIQLVNRSGQVGILHAETVWEKDKYEVIKGMNPNLIHIPHEPKDFKEIESRKAKAFYATCQTKNGCVFETLSVLEAELHRSRFAMFKGEGGPWWKDFPSMAKKTAILKLVKYLPMSAELQNSMQVMTGLEPHGDDENYVQPPLDFSQFREIPNEVRPPEVIDVPKEEKKDAKPAKDDRPDEERQPDGLPPVEPDQPVNKGGTARTADKVKEATRGRRKKEDTVPAMFEGGQQSPREQQLPD